MNIIYVGAFRFPKYDAASARVLNNARCLRANGHNVEFISWGGSYESFRTEQGEQDRYDGFSFIITGELDINGSFWRKLRNRINRGGKTIDILYSKYKEGVDLIISYNPDLVFNLRLKSFTKKRGIKYANDITEWSDKNELRFIERLTNTINLKRTTKTVKNRIVISRYLNNYYSIGNNIVVPPLVHLAEKKWQVSKEKEKGLRDITFIYAGNPAKKDCLHLIINSCQSLLEKGFKIRLLIIGITKEKYVSEYASLLATTNLHHSIHFVGRVPQDIVPTYYWQADYMVLMRERNRKSMAGFPTKFVEAFASGVPVVANLTSDIGDYLKDSETGFVVKDNTADALSETIKRICLLSPSEHKAIKERVADEAKKLDYHYYLSTFEHFIANLQ